MTATTAPTPAEVRPRQPREPLPKWVPGLAGVVIMLVIWQIVGMTMFESASGQHLVPTPPQIIAEMFDDGWAFYWANIKTTASEAFWGWTYGNAIAVILAVSFVQVPFLERALLRLAVAVYCLPIIAVGTIFAVIFEGSTSKIVLAAMAVFFPTMVGMVVGLRSADRNSLDLVRAYGGGSWRQLVKVRLRACLPSLFAALRIAAPAAVLGAVIGEYIGGESGLGVAMIASQQASAVETTWGLALAITALSGVGYAITAFVGDRLTTWAPKVER